MALDALEPLPRYIFLVKNLRGVVASSDAGSLEKVVSWVSSRFRYRDVGVPPELYRAWPRVFEGRLNGNPFHLLGYPSRAALEASRRLLGALEVLGVRSYVAEALALSLYYASPVIASADVYLELERAGLILLDVRGPRLDRQSARLHLRIAGYSVLDSLVELSGRATSCLCKGVCSLEELSSERRAFAERDAKRYWRVSGKGDEVVVAYVDYLPRTASPEIYCGSSDAAVLAGVPVLFIVDSVEG